MFCAGDRPDSALFFGSVVCCFWSKGGWLVLFNLFVLFFPCLFWFVVCCYAVRGEGRLRVVLRMELGCGWVERKGGGSGGHG